MSARWPLVAAALALMVVVQGATHGRRLNDAPPPLDPIAVSGRAPTGPHPRILLDAPALARLRDAAAKKTPAWLAVAAACDRQLAEKIRSGYQGFDWADAVADLALCWRATGERRFADGAVRYLAALLDDQLLIGDGKGGDGVVTHDDGYGMRSFGAFAALGYDWLYDAPSMTVALRARAIARLRAWLRWYGDKGYQRDHAVANYFCGYLLAESWAGLAVSGDSPDGERWFAHARDVLLGRRLLPELAHTLAGGDWPEGWQYGELSAAEVALTAESLRTGAAIELAPKLPWLGQVVTHHLHALTPGGAAVYDNGDWSAHPAAPSPLALTAIALALDGSDPRAAETARWLAHRAPPFAGERLWLPLLAERAGAVSSSGRDPREGAPASYLAAGTGLAFMRSDWSAGAVWASFQSGPTVADHQHNDQGHFELWRGADGLVVDGGDYGSAATASHNTLLVDDGGRHLTYPPNQGVWGRGMRMTRFADGGGQVTATGDFGDAYAPSCAEDGCRQRSVRSAVRTLLFLRPRTLVIDDRVTVDEPGFGVTFAAHVAAAPELRSPRASARVGASRVDLQTVLPAAPRIVARQEPTPTGEGPYRQNQPWGPMWRLEVASPTGKLDRRFLHVLTAGAAADSAPKLTRLDGRGLSGVAIADRPPAAVSVLFADGDAGGVAELAPSAESLVVAGLKPDGRYRVRVIPGARCSVEIAPDDAAPRESTADHAGTLRVATRCTARAGSPGNDITRGR